MPNFHTSQFHFRIKSTFGWIKECIPNNKQWNYKQQRCFPQHRAPTTACGDRQIKSEGRRRWLAPTSAGAGVAKLALFLIPLEF